VFVAVGGIGVAVCVGLGVRLGCGVGVVFGRLFTVVGCFVADGKGVLAGAGAVAVSVSDSVSGGCAVAVLVRGTVNSADTTWPLPPAMRAARSPTTMLAATAIASSVTTVRLSRSDNISPTASTECGGHKRGRLRRMAAGMPTESGSSEQT
jgi:hypothetical protein